MKIVIISKNDRRGGAAIVSLRLMLALQDLGVDASMLVAEKDTDTEGVRLAASPILIKRKFIEERLRIFTANGFNRSTLFQIDTGEVGLPLWKNPSVRDADVVLLNWVNQGMLSLKGVEEILKLGKTVVWTMHDLWNMTGICHHPHECRHFLKECGNCPLLGKKSRPDDLSHKVWKLKKRLYTSTPGKKLQFVAVSNWVRERAGESSLLGDRDVKVIHNAVSHDLSPVENIKKDYSSIHILFGAARLDDPIKGFHVMTRALRIIADKFPGLAERLELITFGRIWNAEIFNDIAIAHRHAGEIHDDAGLIDLYSKGEILVSSSKWETLGMTLAEAQANGVLPVSFDHGGQRDVICHEKNGLLIEWSKDDDTNASRLAENLVRAICLLENQEITPERLILSARKKFLPQQIARQYLELIRELNPGLN